MHRTKLSGIYIPVVTPFNKDESINFNGIKEVTKFLAENGVTGIIPSGSTGRNDRPYEGRTNRRKRRVY